MIKMETENLTLSQFVFVFSPRRHETWQHETRINAKEMN